MITDNILSISDLEDFEGIKVLIEMANELCKESVLMEYSDVYMESDGDPTPSPTPQSTPDPDPLRSRSSSKQSAPPASTKKQSKKTETSDQDVSGKKPSKIKNAGNKIKAFINKIWSVIQGFFDRIKKLFSDAKQKLRKQSMRKITTQIKELKEQGVDISEYGPADPKGTPPSTTTESAYYIESGGSGTPPPPYRHDQDLLYRIAKRPWFKQGKFYTGLKMVNLVKYTQEIRKELQQIKPIFQNIDQEFDQPDTFSKECDKHAKNISYCVSRLKSDAVYQDIHDLTNQFKPTPKKYDPNNYTYYTNAEINSPLHGKDEMNNPANINRREQMRRENVQNKADMIRANRSTRSQEMSDKRADIVNAVKDVGRRITYKSDANYRKSDKIRYESLYEYYEQVNTIVADLAQELTPFYNDFKQLKNKISREIDFLNSDHNYIVKKYGKDIINSNKVKSMEACKKALEDAMNITKDVSTVLIDVLNIIVVNHDILKYTLDNIPARHRISFRSPIVIS